MVYLANNPYRGSPDMLLGTKDTTKPQVRVRTMAWKWRIRQKPRHGYACKNRWLKTRRCERKQACHREGFGTG